MTFGTPRDVSAGGWEGKEEKEGRWGCRVRDVRKRGKSCGLPGGSCAWFYWWCSLIMRAVFFFCANIFGSCSIRARGKVGE